MKIILYNATSIDGYIAKPNKDSEWVSEIDSEIFTKLCKDTGCIFIGRNTFDQYHQELYPIDRVLNIVVTTKKDKSKEENTVFVNSVNDAMEVASNKGYKKVILVGGGTVNTSFLKANLIDEIYLDVHPLVLGNGVKVFENVEVFQKLELLETKQPDEGLVLLHYKVLK